MSEALAVREDGAGVGVLFRRATDVAGACSEIVKKTAQLIQGRKFVRVEGWQSIAAAYGCSTSTRGVEKVPGGFKAIGEVRRMSDGQIIGEGEGFVGEDEPVWFGGGKNPKNGQPFPKRPDYAIRAMAQTRAVSRACRGVFAFVVVMIDENLSTTPAEEMDGVIDGTIIDTNTNAARADALKAKMAAEQRAKVAPAAATQAQPVASGAVFPNYGKAKGAPVLGAALKDLEFYASKARLSLEDPSKERWHAKERALLGAIEEEIARQQLGGVPNPDPTGMDGEEPPPHGDQDAHF